MEELRQILDEMIAALDNTDEFRERLENPVSVYPFNEYDFFLDGRIRIEVKASRAVDFDSDAPLLCKGPLVGFRQTVRYELSADKARLL